MAFGLPSAEEIRDYFISQGKDPAEASRLANVAARQNAAQAARTEALSIAAGAAPARAAGAAAMEAAPAIGKSVMSVGERIAAAPRSAWEYLTKARPVVNPETGYNLRNVGVAGQPRPRPDLEWGVKLSEFTPGQRMAQGAVGSAALGAGSAGTSALLDRPAAAPMPAIPLDGSISGEEYGNRYRQALADSSISGEQGGGTSYLSAAQALGDKAGMPARRPTDQAIQVARERVVPLPPARPAELRPQSGGLASLFSDPYAGKSARDLYAEANRMQSSGDEYGANLLTQRAGKMITKPEDLESSGLATGGAAKPHKDAALHKALDIIAHMLGRR
jgi:hypothetical protein